MFQNHHQHIKHLSLFLLSYLLVLFLHSETGFISHDDDDHHSHDFCVIVKHVAVSVQKSNQAPVLPGYPDGLSVSIQTEALFPGLTVSNHFPFTGPYPFTSFSTYLRNCQIRI